MYYMGDLSQKKLIGKLSSRELIQHIVETGLKYPDLRDEIYCQLCKQTNCDLKSLKM